MKFEDDRQEHLMRYFASNESRVCAFKSPSNRVFKSHSNLTPSLDRDDKDSLEQACRNAQFISKPNVIL